jgi:lysophospholipase L1-like esterase
MSINKVVYNGKTLIDISDSTVTDDNIEEGLIAYSGDGKRVVGTKMNLEDRSKRKLIFIGDSYGDGYTPDGNTTGWCDRLKSKLVNCHFTADNIYINHKGGASFSNPSNNYLTLLKGVQVSNKKMVTDVLIGGGYNELAYGDKADTVKSNIDTVISYVQSTYPNAVVHFAPFGVAFKNRNNQFALRYKLMPAYISKACYTNQPFMLVPGAENILSFENMMSSDGIHPNDWGLENIAEYLKGYILGTGSSAMDKRQLSVGLNGGTFTGTIYGQCLGDINIYRIIFDQSVNHLNSNGTNGFKLYTPVRTNAFPWRAPNMGYTDANAIIQANGGFFDVPVKFNVTNGNELYMQFKQCNSAHNNYQSYSNITQIQLDAWIIAENM